MGSNDPGIAGLLKEAEEAADSSTNGLMDRDDFLILVRNLAAVIRQLLIQCKESDRERNEIARRTASAFEQLVLNQSEHLQAMPRDVEQPHYGAAGA